jgi:hypothetical protein
VFIAALDQPGVLVDSFNDSDVARYYVTEPGNFDGDFLAPKAHRDSNNTAHYLLLGVE